MRYPSASLLALPYALAHPTQSNAIHWTNCTFELPAPGACGTLSVRLDYTNTSSSARLNLTLTKINAAIQPSKGSILINPGGTGNDAASFLAATGDIMQV